MVKLGPQHLKNGRIRITHTKTKATTDVPIHPHLVETLDHHPLNNLAFLMTGQGRPFTAKAFGSFFRAACQRAGVEGRSAHGLRKAACRRLAEAGCTPHQIMAVSGHKTLSEVDRYCREAGRVDLATDAFDRLQARLALTNHPERVVNFPDKPLKTKEN